MKRFIVHVFCFLMAFCLLQVACNTLLLKDKGVPYRHNKRFATQYQNYLAKEGQYNTVFIGSSRTYRQISPQIIDHELGESNIKSYNLGAPGTFMPETFYLLENFIDNRTADTQIMYVFMEFNKINFIKFVNWFAPQSYYYLDMEMLHLIWNAHFSNPDMSCVMAWIYTYPYIQGYIVKNIIPLSLLEGQVEPDIYTGEKRDGFYPLDLDLQQNQSERLMNRHARFLQDTTVLLERKKKQLEKSTEDISLVYIDYLNQLVSKADQKNIKLYFIIPPRLKYYQSLASRKDLIHDQRIIDTGNYEEYPMLNFLRYNFDQGHLNSKGSEIYSTYLAQKIKESLTIQPDTIQEPAE